MCPGMKLLIEVDGLGVLVGTGVLPVIKLVEERRLFLMEGVNVCS